MHSFILTVNVIVIIISIVIVDSANGRFADG